jgi:hypothetical protein
MDQSTQTAKDELIENNRSIDMFAQALVVFILTARLDYMRGRSPKTPNADDNTARRQKLYRETKLAPTSLANPSRKQPAKPASLHTIVCRRLKRA